MDTDRLFSTHDVGRMLKVNPSTVSKWVDRGLVVAHRLPGGHRRIGAANLRTFLLTRGMPLPPELGGPEPRAATTPAPRGRVLALVVDHPAWLSKTVSAVETLFEVHGTGSALEGLLLVGELRPDLVLVDINLPDVHGIKVLKAIRARPANADVRLVAITALPSKIATSRSLTAGAIACLPKPLVAAELARAVAPATSSVRPRSA